MNVKTNVCSMPNPKTGLGVVVGKNVQFGKDVVIWNYVVIGEDVKVDEGTCVGSFCDIGASVVVGRKCNLQSHVTISNGCKIGNNVFIGPNSSLLNDKYPVKKPLTPVVIKDNAIVGGGATVLPGVVVGESSVVAAGSVVTKDVPPQTVVMGVPAEPVMSLQEYEAKRRKFSMRQIEG